MCPFNGYPEGFTTATLALLDQSLMDAWRESLIKNEAVGRTASVETPRRMLSFGVARDRDPLTSSTATLKPRPRAARSPRETPHRSLKIRAD
jgi:hypothetical protein